MLRSGAKRTTGVIGEGEQVTWRARHFWMWHELTSHIMCLQRPIIVATSCARNFRSMAHDHYFRPLSGGQTEMRDVPGRIAQAAFLALVYAQVTAWM